MVSIGILASTICFSVGGIEECHPILAGRNTPVGTFSMVRMSTRKKGYGGDILVFKETETVLFAIHRLYTLNPKQKRKQRLSSKTTKDNIITDGCVNVDPSVYNRLVECCSSEPLNIRK